MKKFILFLLISMYGIFTINAQHTNILIDDVGSFMPPEEPTIIVNPKNTDELVAGSNIDNFYYSVDGGQSWSKGTLSSTYGVWGDPCVIVDTAGSFYFFHLSNPSFGNWIDRIVCQKTDSPGGTWTDGTYMGLNGTKAQDKEWAIVDRTNNNIYVTWTQFDQYGSSDTLCKSNIHFSKSTDGSEIWSDALRINKVSGDCVDDDNTVEGAVPAVGPNGEIYVSWAGPEGIVFDKSLDQGETWLDNDIFVNDMPGGWNMDIPGISRCNGMPVTICDLSNSPYNGTIYINWADQRNGDDDTDIWLSKSTNQGETWSDPVRVNNDPPGKQQFFTWMAIDQTNGYLYFVFYDRRNYENNNTDVYMALSKDGGETFTNFKISESPFLPWDNIFFGDYTNITAHDNIIRPIWARLNDGDLSIWTALVDPFIIGIEEEQYSMFSIEQNYPNPFKKSTVISFKIKQPSQISLKVFDMFGREVATLINNKFLNRGKYTESFNPSQYDLSSGVYYFSLTSNHQNLKRKMIFLK